jgi:acetyl-CoA synthetase
MEKIKEKNSKLKPNMEDYEEVRKRFNWEKVKEKFKLKGSFNPVLYIIEHSIKDKKALIWVNSEAHERSYTYGELIRYGIRTSNLLKQWVRKGDRVIIFSRKVPEIYFSMLGATLLGAVIVPVFPSFSSEALKYRFEDSGAKLIITHGELKEKVKKAINGRAEILEAEILSDLIKSSSEDLESEVTQAEDPWFIIYTSGSTGKPKGIVQSLNTSSLFYISGLYHFDLHEEDVFWPTGDPGWVAGFAAVWTAWIRGVTLLALDSRFSADTWLSLIEKYKVSVWSTAPTALRLMKRLSKSTFSKYDFSSLRFIHAGGEYVGPDLVYWTKEVFKLPLHEAYGQSETSTYVICNFVSLPIKPGSMGKPLPGIEALVVDSEGNQLPPNAKGILAFKPGFPGLLSGVWGNEDKFKSYFKKGFYLTGDMALMDEEGYFWYLGRMDDVIKVSGYRIGSAELEAVIGNHPKVAEVAVIGVPDEQRGNEIKAFIVLKEGVERDEEMKEEIRKWVREKLASHAVPKYIEFVDSLPHTMSGKIMRRLLRAKELNQNPGDLSTLET